MRGITLGLHPTPAKRDYEIGDKVSIGQAMLALLSDLVLEAGLVGAERKQPTPLRPLICVKHAPLRQIRKGKLVIE